MTTVLLPTPRLPEPCHELLVFDLRPERATATVEIVVPVYNEQTGLLASIERLHEYLSTRFPLTWLITIADNASTDDTWRLACRLARDLDGVRAVHLDQKGRGRALRTVWRASASPVVAYMDVDLSTDLDALLPLVAPLVSGHSDLAIGSRLAPSARVTRGPKREAISRSYNLLLRATLQVGFSDAQCGFKAARRDAVQALLPMVEDNGWFFDTELLVLGERNGLRIHEVPVDWIDDPDSRVDVVKTARGDLEGIWRMARRFARGEGIIERPLHTELGREVSRAEQLARFGSIGIVSTVVFGVLFLLLAAPLGIVIADVVALALCTFANVAANRRLTFFLAGRSERFRHHVRGLVVGLLPLALNLAVVSVLTIAGVASTFGMLAGLTLVNAAAGVARFSLLDRWVFDRRAR